tara:strand:- start:885 stop:1934 length:1050 start_codon:yes stop_codon:yes gene_type:complete
MLKLKSLLKESKLILEFNAKTNIADVDAVTIVDQLETMDSGMDDTEIGQAMQNATGWAKGALGGATGDKSPSAMVADIGRDELIKRIKDVQSAVSNASPGLPKSEMPALEGSDAQNVKDALSDTAGTIAVDLAGKWGMGDGSGDFDKWWNSLDAEKKALFDKPGFDDIDVIAQEFGVTSESKQVKETRIKLVNLLKEDPMPNTGGKAMDGAPTKGEKQTTDLDSLKGKAKAFLMKGMLDGGAKDSIDVAINGNIANSAMKPTQGNILIGKSMLFALNQWNGASDLSDMEGAFVTTDGEILDGHHRWSGASIATGGSLNHSGVHTVAGKAATLIPILTVIGNALGRDNKS